MKLELEPVDDRDPVHRMILRDSFLPDWLSGTEYVVPGRLHGMCLCGDIAPASSVPEEPASMLPHRSRHEIARDARNKTKAIFELVRLLNCNELLSRLIAGFPLSIRNERTRSMPI